ncbi:carbohydrate kinase family protein [Azonexus sp.]|jgi:adenosine kinase|uniref:carbohydrate kinase family protein n=1 Tax=Azonexus sp. TaxID=1872668 RepID=UPI00282C5334|nr:carbohydrate kinase family protein [Azonexus sp.]MDR1995742.1 carbohydrate kinase family protein [Azonexus sp.]
MTTLICGSLAFDNIMVFPDRFKNHILPEQIHILNVAFLVPDMRREYGGCAGNIAYNLKLLGGEPLIMATVGDDAAPYLERLDRLDLARTHVRQIAGSFTAQAFITTDLDDNQITAFHPGAMSFSHLNKVDQATGARLGIVAPDGREGMLQHARDFAAAGVPFIFDPGQGLPMFSGDELLDFMSLADYACFNDYEAKLLCDRTGRSLDELATTVRALIVTRGSEGSDIYADGVCHAIPCVAADAIVDPTGCGDAYRAGLLYGIASGFDWPSTGRLAAVMGAIKIARRGGQNHQPSREEIAVRYQRAFGSAPW